MVKTRNTWPRAYTLEEKIALVTEIERRYRAGGGTLKAAAQAAGTTDTSYNNWLRAGIRPLPATRPAPPRPYPPEERKRLLGEVDHLLAGGMGIDAACRQVGISDSSYRKWRDEMGPPPAMRPVEVTALVPVTPTALTLAPPRSAAAFEAGSTLVLVAPGGYRIEGLGVETAAALLRALS
jgi:transposase-like protein